MKTYFQLETKCSGWSCQEENFQLSPFIVVCYSWTVEYNWGKFTKRLRLLAGLLMGPIMRGSFSCGLPGQLDLSPVFQLAPAFLILLPVACLTWQRSSSRQEPLCSTFLDPRALEIQRAACPGCVFRRGCLCEPGLWCITHGCPSCAGSYCPKCAALECLTQRLLL